MLPGGPGSENMMFLTWFCPLPLPPAINPTVPRQAGFKRPMSTTPTPPTYQVGPLCPAHHPICRSQLGRENGLFLERIRIRAGIWVEICFFFVCLFVFRASPTAYGSSQAKGQNGAAATPQPQQCQILNQLSKARDQTGILMVTCQVHFHSATMGTLDLC